MCTNAHACCAVMLACLTNRGAFKIHIQHFFPLFIPLPYSLHFRVLLDRTTLAAGNSPLSTLHPKACGFCKPVCACVCASVCLSRYLCLL